MAAQQRNSESPQELPFIRSHSPYCEATGPIVERGFVAAQIRALQGAYNRAWTPLRSHSPMVPCPIEQRLQRYESGPPQISQKLSKKSHRHQLSQSSESFANGVSKPVQNAYSRRSIFSSRTSSGSDNTEFQKQQGADFVRKLKSDRPKISKTEKEIRKISRNNSITGSNQWTNAHVSSPRLLTIATELMSGGGRNAQMMNIDSESVTSPVNREDHQRARSPKFKIAEELSSMIDLELGKRQPPCEANGSSDSSVGKPEDRFPGIALSPGAALFLGSSEKKTSASLLQPIGNDGSKSPGDIAQRKLYQYRRKMRQKKSAEALITNQIKTQEEAIEEILTTPKRIQRAWSFQQPHRSRRKATDPTKLRFFSVDHNSSHNKHNRNHDSHDGAQKSPSESGQLQNLSPRSKSSHRCSRETSTLSCCSQSGRSTDKSSGPYVTPPGKAQSRWRWWKLVFIDKQASTSDSSSQTPSLAASIKFEDDQHSHQSGSRHGQEKIEGSKVIHTLAGCGQRVEIQKARPRIVEETPKLEQYRGLKMREARHASNACSTTSSIQLTSQMLGGGPQEEQVSEWVTKSPKNEPLEGCSPVLHCKLQTSCSKEPTEGQHNGRGQRVKQVQVIVSLDGATDFIVEAYLEKSPHNISGVL